MLARSADDDLVVCAVVPAPWYPSPARVDAEYRDYLHGDGARRRWSRRARGCPPTSSSTFVVHDARSVPAGLLEVAEQHDAALIVVGSSSAGGAGHVTLGSTSSRLLYSSPDPGRRGAARLPLRAGRAGDRVTAAFGGTESAENLVIAAAGVAARVGATLRLASFAVRSRPPYTIGGRDRRPTRTCSRSGAPRWRRPARAALAKVADLPAVPAELEIAIGRGENWEEALDDIEWDDGDVLVVGSSTIGPVARVFLGSRGGEDRPPLPRARRRRPARRGRGARGGGAGA